MFSALYIHTMAAFGGTNGRLAVRNSGAGKE
jgi:hypothetical protein